MQVATARALGSRWAAVSGAATVAAGLVVAEAAYRGYTLTDAELETWQQGTRQIRDDLSALGTAAMDNPRQIRNLDRVETSLEAVIAKIDLRIAFQKEHGRQAGLEAFRRDQALLTVAQIQTVLSNMRQQENRLFLVKRRQAISRVPAPAQICGLRGNGHGACDCAAYRGASRRTDVCPGMPPQGRHFLCLITGEERKQWKS